MKEWFIRIILLAVLGALGYWGWTLFFPSPEKVIRKQLHALATEASFAPKQSLITQAWNASVLESFFTPDVQVTITVPGTEHSINGRAELLQAALGAHQVVSSLQIDLPDIKVVVAPGKEAAVVNLTARGKVSGQKDYYLQELRLRLIKVKRDWLINEIVTVRTLS
jgi:cytoskeletal protein RodZ